MKKILVVDDEIEMLESFEKILKHRGDFTVTLISDPVVAVEKLKSEKFDIVITDLMLGGKSGLDFLRSALSKYPDVPVIMISGYGTIETGVEAMREGAFDFLEKPFTSKSLFDCIDRALAQSYKVIQPIEENKKNDLKLSGIIYQSSKIGNLIDIIKKVAPGNMNVLITGESGTGKELFARAIHGLSKRSMEPFVPVNCAALPEHLFESELFGYEKGAFTGAVKTKLGLLEYANHGTFFFDEIGDMSLSLQVKMLRMLEERKIRRVGGKEEINIDIRIIAATNQLLEKNVQEKKFREDLYYRLTTMHIHIPPLRERTEDIIPLANYFLADLVTKNDTAIKRFSPEAENALKLYGWPGNIREMQNIVSRAYYLSSSGTIQKSELPVPVCESENGINKEIFKLSYQAAKDLILEKFEVEYIEYNLALNNGNISKTAAVCGIDRRTIHRLINKYNIQFKEE